MTCRTDRGGVARRSRLAVGIAVCLLGLSAVSGCGTQFTPGVAASINGEPISQGHVDSVVQAACAYTAASTAASGQTVAPRSLANLRSSITQALVQFSLTDRVASGMHLTVSQAAVDAAASQSQVPPGVSTTDTATLKGFFQDFAKSSVELKLIGAHLADPSVTTIAQVKQDMSAQANKYLTSYAARQDVTVNPAYGRWNGSAVIGGSGSLSDPVSPVAKAGQAAATNAQADTSALPASQVC